MASCIGANRERFEKELRRGRYVGRTIVVIEGTLADLCVSGANISHNAIMGTLPPGPCVTVLFCGSQREAANFAFRLLAAQVRDAERTAKAITKARGPQLLSLPPCQAPKEPWRASWSKKRPLPTIGRTSQEETGQS